MENKVVKGLVLGLSAVVGFVVTDVTYNLGVKWLHKEQEKKIIDLPESEIEELES